MEIDKQQIKQHVRRRVPSLGEIRFADEIEEGNLNHVWRVRGDGGSCIVKYAPPYIASQPDVPLSQHRAVIEARALESLNRGKLQSVPCNKVRVPKLWGFDKRIPLLFMEDIPHEETLGDLIRQDAEVESYLRNLAVFIARLHRTTYRKSWAENRFDNQPMQETRFEIQYQPISRQLEEAGIEGGAALGEKARELGIQLQQRGKCMVMGDIWPPGVLVGRDTLHVIDWELDHYGRPLQDVGHLSAHLWLYARAYGQSPESLLTPFLNRYRKSLGNQYQQLWDRREKRGMAVHMAAEIIIRILGAFSVDYLGGIYQQEEMRREGLDVAVQLLREEDYESLEGGE